MAIERERKFKVDWLRLPTEVHDMVEAGKGHTIESGYFTKDGVAIRVTIKNHGQPNARYKVCFKSRGGQERQEFEYTIPEADALALMKLAPYRLNKERYDYEGWEIDRIELLNGPTTTYFWVAEWEEHEGKTIIPTQLPPWITVEVTDDWEFSMQGLCFKYGRQPG